MVHIARLAADGAGIAVSGIDGLTIPTHVAPCPRASAAKRARSVELRAPSLAVVG